MRHAVGISVVAALTWAGGIAARAQPSAEAGRTQDSSGDLAAGLGTVSLALSPEARTDAPESAPGVDLATTAPVTRALTPAGVITLPLTMEALRPEDGAVVARILASGGSRGLAGLGSGLRLSFGRSTGLRDGGIDGARAPQLDDSDDRLWGFANDSGEFDLYDMSVEWDAWKPGAFAVSLIGGVRAIQADVGRVREQRGDDGGTYTTLDEARGLVAVPVLGTGLRYDASEAWSFSARASTHAGGDGRAFVGLSAETSLMISPTIGLHAGYQSVRSVLEVRSVDAELREEGLFARLTIEF